MGASRRKLLPTVASPSAGPSAGKPRRSPNASEDIIPTTTLPEEQAVYVYCVVRGGRAPRITQPEPRLPGVGEPRVVPLAGRTWVIAADVPLSVYGARAIEPRLRDVKWVSACGVAHQAMVDACMRSSDAVVPMKVFTIFNSDARAKAELKRHADQLRDVMQQVAGCVEWGVRITRAPQPWREYQRQVERERISARAKAAAEAAAAAAAPEPAAAQAPASGTEFLKSKVRERAAVRNVQAMVHEHVQALAKSLDVVTRDVRYRHETVRGTVPVLLDAAYLVPRRAEERFRAQIRLKSQPLLAHGCRVTVTGPWPAYSFVSPAGR
jgi:hypothetical protein